MRKPDSNKGRRGGAAGKPKGKGGPSKRTSRNKKSESGGEPTKKIFVKDYSGNKKPPRKQLKVQTDKKVNDGTIRLNRYISNAGICSRREADELIRIGTISVNGKIVTEVGTKVKVTDKVQYDGETLRIDKMVYLILNKPKDYSVAVHDPQKKKTVLEIIGNACKEQIAPIGKMDRSMTGVVLFTNDAELTTKLMNPRHEVKKIFHVEITKNIDAAHFKQIVEGIELEDGWIKPDKIAYASKENKKEFGVEIHSNRPQIVARIFEHFGYSISKIDRVYYAGLTKKLLKRGQWRMLTENEVHLLKMLG